MGEGLGPSPEEMGLVDDAKGEKMPQLSEEEIAQREKEKAKAGEEKPQEERVGDFGKLEKKRKQEERDRQEKLELGARSSIKP